MARIKNKIARYAVYVNQAQDDALKAMMKEDMADTPSAFIGSLIAKEWTRRTKPKPQGRPKKEQDEQEQAKQAPEEEEVRDIPHPDTFGHEGEFMTATEYAGYCALKGLDPSTGMPLK